MTNAVDRSRVSERAESSDYEIVRPNAAAMIEAMRAFGYSPATAIADLVDNSISAGAENVQVSFWWNGAKSTVTVLDDGRGMTDEQLSTAMRLGSENPRNEREPGDLGRFGLGLKTASFSQCRSLTVASKPASHELAVRRWDLDYVNDTEEWCLLTEPAPGSAMPIQTLKDADGGTVVVWDKLDRLVGDDVAVDDSAAHDRFRSVISHVEQHLAMTFHRFLEGRGAISLCVNGQRLEPWDPFLESERFTQRLPDEVLTLRGDHVTVSPFVLPHHSKLDQATHSRAAGTHGWNGHQGFYIYRGGRLLVPGDWLRLGFQKEEHCKLARVRVDLPNSMDAAWQIDVRKATARPPGQLRADLRRVAEVVRRKATQVYRHRGKALARSVGGEQTFVWRQAVRRGKIIYTLNRGHPLIAQAVARDPEVEVLLRMTEETVPVPLIALKAAEHPDEQAAPFEGGRAGELEGMAQRVLAALTDAGMTPDQARAQLAHMEPFNLHPEIIETLRNEG
jgi:hypothetical protein